MKATQLLEAHYMKLRNVDLRKLFAGDPTRGERVTARDSSTNNRIRRYRALKEDA